MLKHVNSSQTNPHIADVVDGQAGARSGRAKQTCPKPMDPTPVQVYHTARVRATTDDESAQNALRKSAEANLIDPIPVQV